VTEQPESPEIAEVRRLLAEARHTGPMPDDVSARMHDVLAGLSTDSEPRPATTAPVTDPRYDDVVVPIAAHRRRRVAGLLVAAAAIVVGGVTIAPHLGSDPGSTGSTGAAAQDSAGGSSDLGNTGNDAQQPENAPEPPQKGFDSQLQLKKGLVVVRPRHFSSDARQGRTLLLRGDVRALRSASAVPCSDVPGRGRRLGAEYEHAPAVLVYRRAEGSSQVVDLFVCGIDRPVRSTTLPVP
jgi:hypothetical protein